MRREIRWSRGSVSGVLEKRGQIDLRFLELVWVLALSAWSSPLHSQVVLLEDPGGPLVLLVLLVALVAETPTTARPMTQQNARGPGQGSDRAPLRPLVPAHPHRGRPGLDRSAFPITIQVVGELLGRRVSPLRVLVQALQADGLEIAGQPRHQP